MKMNWRMMGLWGALFVAGAAQAFTLASKDIQATVVVGEGEPEHVWLAALDLQGDVEKISGVKLKVRRGKDAGRGDVFISTADRGRDGDVGGSPRAASAGWESYSVAETNGVLRITGSDDRGTMFGIYDFIERYLQVDPVNFWSDVAYPKKATLSWEKVEIVQGEPSFRFRGWFLNDEDLLTMWRKASGVRDYSSYRYYNCVVNHEVMERIAESLVRSRMNMIIPASLLNITRPAEEGLVEICAKRGVFVTMHHIEPLGLSGFTFKDYWRKRGQDLEYSYFKHPKEVEACWRECAKKWARFPNVIWQIGLRGTGDRPMWTDDPTMPKDDAGRAKLISDALAKQVEILDEIGVPKEGRILTTTLWGEGAYFNERGLLKFPEGTIIVFADNNCGWKWPKDLTDGARTPGVGYGVYYHHQLIGMGPHLASLVPAAKTHEMLLTARGKGAATYAIFNVGNLREFVYNLGATSAMTWNLDAFDAEAWTRNWLTRRVPSAADAWNAALNVYHRSLQLNPPTGIPCFLDGQMKQQYNDCLKRMEKVARGKAPCRSAKEPMKTVYPQKKSDDPFHAALGETHPMMASPSDTYMRLSAQRASYDQALLFGRRAMAKTAVDEQRFAQDFLVYPALVMRGLTDARMEGVLAEEALLAGENGEAIARLEAAAETLGGLVALGEDYCHGKKWENWYRGCEKVSPRLMMRRTLEVIEAVRGME